MIENDGESIDNSELKGILTTKGTKRTKKINNQELDDLLEFNTRCAVYGETHCPTPINCHPGTSHSQGSNLAKQSNLRSFPLSCISSLSW
jgi:hypothetical protein